MSTAIAIIAALAVGLIVGHWIGRSPDEAKSVWTTIAAKVRGLFRKE